MRSSGASVQTFRFDSYSDQSVKEYRSLLEEEIFKAGESKGRLRTALTVLTDMLIELNALEIYYQKPVAKSINPPEIEALRKKLEMVKQLLHASVEIEE